MGDPVTTSIVGLISLAGAAATGISAKKAAKKQATAARAAAKEMAAAANTSVVTKTPAATVSTQPQQTQEPARAAKRRNRLQDYTLDSYTTLGTRKYLG